MEAAVFSSHFESESLMGGFGSGRYQWSSKATVEDCRARSLAIKAWVDRGLVQPGNTFTQQWLDEDGGPEASIHVRIATVNPVHPALALVLSGSRPVPDRLQAV